MQIVLIKYFFRKIKSNNKVLKSTAICELVFRSQPQHSVAITNIFAKYIILLWCFFIHIHHCYKFFATLNNLEVISCLQKLSKFAIFRMIVMAAILKISLLTYDCNGVIQKQGTCQFVVQRYCNDFGLVVGYIILDLSVFL